jgi:lysyl-tRNA synthetase class 2
MDFSKKSYQLSKSYFELIATIRQFFSEKNFLDLPAPPMVPHPGLEAHLHPFKIQKAKEKSDTGFYLHTSPEFFMKEMLALGHEKIFTLTHCHRDEPVSSTHLPQFLMLEWYRTNERYEKIMDDTEELISSCFKKFNRTTPPFIRKTVDEIFLEFCDFKISQFLDRDKLFEKISSFDNSLLTEINLSWDDLFFLIFLNHIEPKLKRYPALILYEYPAPLAALSTLKNETVCERFEVYLGGVELANCFNELTDLNTLKKRFEKEDSVKQQHYQYKLPAPHRFFDVQKKLPNCAGIALGVDRLFMTLMDLEEIYTPSDYFKASDN